MIRADGALSLVILGAGGVPFSLRQAPAVATMPASNDITPLRPEKFPQKIAQFDAPILKYLRQG